MSVFSLLRDAWFFYSRHLGFILSLCLPLVLLESITRQLLEHWSAADTLPMQDLIAGLLFYPLYTAALILFMEGRNQNISYSRSQLFSMALQRWLPLALLVSCVTTLIMLGGALYLLPGLWVMIKTSLAEFLLIERNYAPFQAIRESFVLTRGRFWLILGISLATLVPLMLAEYLLMGLLPNTDPWTQCGVDLVLGIAQLFATVVFFRLYMLIMPQKPQMTP